MEYAYQCLQRLLSIFKVAWKVDQLWEQGEDPESHLDPGTHSNWNGTHSLSLGPQGHSPLSTALVVPSINAAAGQEQSRDSVQGQCIFSAQAWSLLALSCGLALAYCKASFTGCPGGWSSTSRPLVKARMMLPS